MQLNLIKTYFYISHYQQLKPLNSVKYALKIYYGWYYKTKEINTKFIIDTS